MYEVCIQADVYHSLQAHTTRIHYRENQIDKTNFIELLRKLYTYPLDSIRFLISIPFFHPYRIPVLRL